MKYLSFLTRLKKAQYIFLVAFIIIAFTQPASAKSRFCRGSGECWTTKLNCGDYCLPPTWRCQNLLSFKPSSSNSLYKEKGGRAFLIIDGVRTQVASDAFEKFLLSKMKEANSTMDGVSPTRKSLDEKLEKDIDAFLKTDDGFVSDANLESFSRELLIPITYEGKEETSFAFIKIKLVNEDNKRTLSAMTDGEGKFRFSEIPDGTYKVLISKPNGKLPKVGTMTINGFGHIVCCCPGPPCEDPFWLIVGANPIGVRGALLLEPARQFVGTVTIVK